MSLQEFRDINRELQAISRIQTKENIVICQFCTGKGYLNKNFRNKDGSATLLKDKTCDSCKGKGVVVFRNEVKV